jgi:excinuclease UvrABC helicase subunit UvrB
MFGFTFLRSSVFGQSDDLFSDDFLKNLSGFDKEVELEGATLLDVHRYEVNDLTYEQKVYRLRDHSIFTETKTIRDSALETKKLHLAKAIEEQRFEDAAKLRDEIKALKTK